MLADTCTAAHAADGADVQDALYEVTGRHTVPQVFVKGSFIGGADGALPPSVHATLCPPFTWCSSAVTCAAHPVLRRHAGKVHLWRAEEAL